MKVCASVSVPVSLSSAMAPVVLRTTILPIGVMGLDLADAGPVPAALVAVTVQVYDVPLLNPPTVKGLAVPLAV